MHLLKGPTKKCRTRNHFQDSFTGSSLPNPLDVLEESCLQVLNTHHKANLFSTSEQVQQQFNQRGPWVRSLRLASTDPLPLHHTSQALKQQLHICIYRVQVEVWKYLVTLILLPMLSANPNNHTNEFVSMKGKHSREAFMDSKM